MRPDGPEAYDLGREGEAAAWSVRLSEGPLDPAAQRAFHDWLEADPGNAAALEAVTDVWRAVDHHRADPDMLELRQQALASAQRANRRRIRGANAWIWRWGATAAAIALGVSFAGGYAVWAPKSFRTGLGERRVVALADGSKVSLDADTVVSVRYAFGRRQLWLRRGRAKFDVARDPLRPFTVDAADREVVATGTSFSVELVQGQVRVILYQGHVAILDVGRRAPAKRRTPAAGVTAPAAGQELVTAAHDNGSPPSAVVASVDPVRTLSWEAGQLVFEDEPLATATERMNRYADQRLVLGDDATGRIRISGVFSTRDSGAFVQGVTAAFPVRARSEGETIILTSIPNSKKMAPGGSANATSRVTP